MQSLAVVLEAPGQLALRPLELVADSGSASAGATLGAGDILVESEWSGVSTGTEKLLWSGRMPQFPGMGYPLVPGYETVGRVIDAGQAARGLLGQRVFVPGASCYAGARGLFGGTASHMILPAARALPVGELGADAVLLALAATAHHALAGGLPDLIVGHGVLGRLLARQTVAAGGQPLVWETRADRRSGATGYAVIDPDADARRDYATIIDASGDASLFDTLIARLRRGGELVLAGFYEGRIAFAFAPAFQREARLRIAAEFTAADLAAVQQLAQCGQLRLDGLISHSCPAQQAEAAYPMAFEDPRCLKLRIDWRGT